MIFMLTHNKSHVVRGFRIHCSLEKDLLDTKKRWIDSDVTVNVEFELCNCKENCIENLEGFASHLGAKDDMWHRSLLVDYLV